MSFKLFTLKSFPSQGFDLTPIEFKDVIPFEVKRTYYLVMKENGSTGQHCHKVELEVFILIKGKITIILDGGKGKEEVVLQSSGSAVFVPAYVWHGFKDASSDCVVLAMSSTNYSADRSDYVENYDEYLKVRDAKLGL